MTKAGATLKWDLPIVVDKHCIGGVPGNRTSMIVAPYRDGQSRIVGVLGVIGPTRLNYARIVPMVDYTAKVLSRLIG